MTLQRVLEESSPVLVSARLDAEERRNNMRLREEQDAAYRAALEADQVCFLQFMVLFFLFHIIFVGLYSMGLERTGLLVLWINVVYMFRLGSDRGEKKKNVLQGKLLKLRGSAKRRMRLVKEQHKKLQRNKLH